MFQIVLFDVSKSEYNLQTVDMKNTLYLSIVKTYPSENNFYEPTPTMDNNIISTSTLFKNFLLLDSCCFFLHKEGRNKSL